MDTSTKALAKSENKGEIVIYQTKDGMTNIDVKLVHNTLWLTQRQMAELFRKSYKTISKHINNIYKEKELDRSSTVSFFETVQIEGARDIKRSIEYYNLDMILSVGYRVSSKQGTQFRIWATGVLRDHIIKGYTVNMDRLAEFDVFRSYVSDTLRVTTMSINRLMIDSARQKDFAVLAEDVEKMKEDLKVIKKKLPEKSG